MKILIVGGVAGGMSAATRLRRLMEDAEIIVLEKGPYVSFANCGLPYFIAGEITNREQLLLQTPESLKARFGLDVRPNQEVLAIHPEQKTVTIRRDSDTYQESYDKLILAPGAKAIVPKIPGLDRAKNCHQLRNVPDMDAILKGIDQHTRHAVVIGAGFIGLEMVESLKIIGLAVTVVEKAPQVLPTMDEEMAAYVKNELIAKGIRVITGQSATSFEEEGKKIRLEDNTVLDSDLTLLSVGVQPESRLAVEAGIATGIRGGILVDETYQTSQKDIYAVGDAIVTKQQLTGEDALISLASPANRQGRQVADVIAGLPRKKRGNVGTAILRVFGLTAAMTGLSEQAATAAGLQPAVIHVSGKDHAGYYPGAKDLLLKLIFNKETGTLYGAQAVGQSGVDKRIDVLATAIKSGLTVADLPELELSYAPPFGSAKDPVNLIGYAALNLIEGLSESIQWHELSAELAAGKQLLDVRNTTEMTGRFKNALHIPLNELRDRLSELDPTVSYIVSCHSGLRSYLAERILKQSGYEAKNLDGAFALYQTVRPEEIIHVSLDHNA
ncbi:FAD-dependent oxidoreductase [Enterococcus sp.]|uniref:FAD-dependent oxidoreductase n=1 Tax=Enterococcus sp. TaxID=35783 RepID=UPI0025B91EDD|nr:FAD-dependent oxidoreductase [Enterococcus sp.]